MRFVRPLFRSAFVVFLWFAAQARAVPPLDLVVFGDGGSEAAHGLSAELSVAELGPPGTTLAQPCRYFTPATPAGIYGGSATFSLAVDPSRQNYFSAKLWGGDDGVSDGTHTGRLYVYVLLDGREYQLGYRHEGDHLASISNDAPFPSLPGRFFYSTVMLPLWMTQGRSELRFKVIASGRIYALGSGYAGDGGNYQFDMNKNSRGLYRAYTHVEPRLEPVGEVQGAAPVATTKPENSPASYLGSGGSFHNAVRGQINNRLNNTPSLASSIFNPAGVEYLAYSYFVSGRIDPFQTALPGYQNPAVVARVRDLLDLYSANHYADPGSVDGWGGAYGPPGHAVHLLREHFGADLDAAVDYGSAGGVRTRRQAWGDLLHASREFGRFNRRSLTNQTLIADENIYKANLGLLALGDSRAMDDATAQRYLREAAGIEPWLGSDLAAGGSARPFGDAYFQVTSKGLTREWGYVGANYGEMAHHVSDFYRITGNAVFRDQAIKMLRARAPFRTPSFEVKDGVFYRRMAAVGFLAWRGAGESDGNGFGGDTTYGERPGAMTGLVTAAATLDPHAVGYAKQMFEDRQFFPLLASPGSLHALDVFADYVTVRDAPDSGLRLPMGDGQPDFARADEENGVLALKRGAERLWIAPYWQAKAGTAINGVGRFHYSNGLWDQIGTLAVTPRFDFGGRFFVRPARIDKPEADLYVPPNPPLNAFAGEKLPLGASPADATADDPFRGKADFYAFRFGPYLIGMNRDAARTHELLTPAGFGSALDLFSGSERAGIVEVAPGTTVALLLDQETDTAPAPATPTWLELGIGVGGPELTWAPAAGASAYTVRRATSAAGPFAVVATGVVGTTHTDADVSIGTTYHYTVTATNAHGESYPSHAHSIVAASGRAILSFNFAPASGHPMSPADRAGAPGVRASRWNAFAGGSSGADIVNAAGETVTGVTVALSNGNGGGFSDRGGSTGDEAALFRTVLDKFNGSAATLAVTGIPHATYDVYFYVYPDENSAGANDRGGSFTVGATTYFLRTGTATRVAGPDDYRRATSTALGTGMDVALANYVRFENLSGPLSASFTAQNINGGAQRLKVAGFQIVGRVAPPPASVVVTATNDHLALAWEPSAEPGVRYVVSRAESAEGAFVTAASDLETTEFTDTDVRRGTTYRYTVSVVNSAGRGPPSEPAGASLPTTALMDWRFLHFGRFEAEAEAADEADPDGDALANLIEYATDSSPVDAGSRRAPAVSIDDSTTPSRLRLDFTRVADPALTYAVLAADEVGGAWVSIWESAGAENTAGPVAVADPQPLGLSAGRFLRLRVSR